MAVGVTGPAAAQAPTGNVEAAADPSPHAERWIEAHGAQLYVLDWGGQGPVLLFMPGYGMGAHVFDEIAPAFRDRFHVLAITPRGFPPSSAPDSGYTISQLAADVAVVLDTLGARRAVLVGHSISGAVITRFAEKYPARLLAAVYLDGAFDFGKVYRDAQTLPIRHPPPTVDTTTAHYRAWERRNNPPSPLLDRDYRMWDIPAADRQRRLALVSQLATEVRSTPHEFWRVRAPALAICAQSSFDHSYGWLTPDSTRWMLAQKVFHEGLLDQRRRCNEFHRRMPRGESLLLESGHLVFVDRPAAVTRAMRRFLARVLRLDQADRAPVRATDSKRCVVAPSTPLWAFKHVVGSGERLLKGRVCIGRAHMQGVVWRSAGVGGRWSLVNAPLPHALIPVWAPSDRAESLVRRQARSAVASRSQPRRVRERNRLRPPRASAWSAGS